MRTTLSIADELLASAKQRARERHLTLGQVVEAALRRELSEQGRSVVTPEIPVFVGGTGPRPGLDVTSNRALVQELDQDVPLDKLR
ncbi:MAG: antitoxin [Actinobacteria bacterium]|nr:antitoxin [Actinomycetota bacterium]MCA1721808.1 antitoxin [Actinomycetota bacterium]